MAFARWMNGTAGRTARVIAGAALIALGALVGGAGGLTLAIVGLVPLVAGLAGVCLIAPLLRTSLRIR
jgi:Inner membrane protein YgaP-like, transmembrane domain